MSDHRRWISIVETGDHIGKGNPCKSICKLHSPSCRQAGWLVAGLMRQVLELAHTKKSCNANVVFSNKLSGGIPDTIMSYTYICIDVVCSHPIAVYITLGLCLGVCGSVDLRTGYLHRLIICR